MQTRRKSLNLGDLGVIAPKRSRAISHPSPPETVVEGDEPPAKKHRRSHDSPSGTPFNLSPARASNTIRHREERRKLATSQLSPPPSPVAEGRNKVDTEGINDDVVVGVIRQLEETGNRPHLVKELATVLSRYLPSVERSANQNALISSRLTAYLQRPWPAISPCPLAKEVSNVHPRRLYYYLTTSPRQPIPPYAPPLPVDRIISPSLSSTTPSEEAEDEKKYLQDRQAMSPSPEVDLSSADFERDNGPAPFGPGSSFSGRNSLPRDRPAYTAHRRNSPPLEIEERDFKQTATELHEQAQAARRNSSEQDAKMTQDTTYGEDISAEQRSATNATASIELADMDHQVTAELFDLRLAPAPHMEFSSPVLRPQAPSFLADEVDKSATAQAPHDAMHDHAMCDVATNDIRETIETIFSIDDLQNPEDIELDELDDMFDSF